MLLLLQAGLGENAKLSAPVLGVTVAEAAAGAHPSAAHNTFHVLHVDVPV